MGIESLTQPVESLRSDKEIIEEVKRLTFALKFDEALSLTRSIENNEFAIRAAIIVIAAEDSYRRGTFIGHDAHPAD